MKRPRVVFIHMIISLLAGICCLSYGGGETEGGTTIGPRPAGYFEVFTETNLRGTSRRYYAEPAPLWEFRKGDDFYGGSFTATGSDDLIIMCSQGRGLALAKVNQSGTLEILESWLEIEDGRITRLLPGDFDGDGMDEIFAMVLTRDLVEKLVVFEFSDGELITLWLHIGARFAENGNEFTFNFGHPFCVGDFDGDGKDELLHYSRNSYGQFRFTDGALHFDKAYSDVIPFAANSLYPDEELGNFSRGWDITSDDKLLSEDFDGDGADEIFLLKESATSGYWSAILEFENGSLTTKNLFHNVIPRKTGASCSPFSFNISGNRYCAGDLDGDGSQEIVMMNNYGIYLSILKYTGSTLGAVVNAVGKVSTSDGSSSWTMDKSDQFITGRFAGGMRDLILIYSPKLNVFGTMKYSTTPHTLLLLKLNPVHQTPVPIRFDKIIPIRRENSGSLAFTSLLHANSFRAVRIYQANSSGTLTQIWSEQKAVYAVSPSIVALVASDNISAHSLRIMQHDNPDLSMMVVTFFGTGTASEDFRPYDNRFYASGLFWFTEDSPRDEEGRPYIEIPNIQNAVGVISSWRPIGIRVDYANQSFAFGEDFGVFMGSSEFLARIRSEVKNSIGDMEGATISGVSIGRNRWNEPSMGFSIYVILLIKTPWFLQNCFACIRYDVTLSPGTCNIVEVAAAKRITVQNGPASDDVVTALNEKTEGTETQVVNAIRNMIAELVEDGAGSLIGDTKLRLMVVSSNRNGLPDGEFANGVLVNDVHIIPCLE